MITILDKDHNERQSYSSYHIDLSEKEVLLQPSLTVKVKQGDFPFLSFRESFLPFSFVDGVALRVSVGEQRIDGARYRLGLFLFVELVVMMVMAASPMQHLQWRSRLLHWRSRDHSWRTYLS
jgi:hypothetical protein